MSDNFVRQTNKKEILVSRIVTVLYLENSSDFVFGGESHDFWEFNYIDKGQMVVTVGGNEYLLKSGEMVFFKPNEFHSLRPHTMPALARLRKSPCQAVDGKAPYAWDKHNQNHSFFRPKW